MNKHLPPPAPFGNQRALGNQGGAPEKYTEEWIREEVERFLEWMRRPESVYFKSFCIERGYHPNRLQEFADKSPEFAGALEMAKAWQEQKLVNLGLWNKTNCSMTKFVLTNCHKWDGENDSLSGKDEKIEQLTAMFRAIDGASASLLPDGTEKNFNSSN